MHPGSSPAASIRRCARSAASAASPPSSAARKGAWVETEDGRKLIDYVGSWGPMILGHAHPDVIAAVTRRAADGLSFGAPTVIETELARKVVELMPSIELRADGELRHRGDDERDPARARLHRPRPHRQVRGLLPRPFRRAAGQGRLRRADARRARPPRACPAAVAAHTTTLAYNDIRGLEDCFAAIGDEIACVIVEPVAGNMNCVPPVPGFLQRLRELCTRHGAVLIFDEVMTGFRVARGGAQELYGVRPDLTTLGKIIGGGMPVGAFGGRRDIMEQLAPLGPGLPGGHAVRQPGRDGGGPRDARGGLATRFPRSARRRDRPADRRPRRRRR